MGKRIPIFNKSKILKRYIKFLSISKNPIVTQTILREAPDSVIKTICNSALNTYKGSISISKPQKKLLSKHRSAIEKLISPKISIKNKKKLLVQKGNGLGSLVPILLSTALSVLPALLSNSK